MNGRMNETVFWFLDLDDTILDFHESERCSLIKTMAGYGRPVTPEEVLSLCRALIADGVRKKDAAKQVAQQTGLSAKELYAALIETP